MKNKKKNLVNIILFYFRGTSVPHFIVAKSALSHNLHVISSVQHFKFFPPEIITPQ